MPRRFARFGRGRHPARHLLGKLRSLVLPAPPASRPDYSRQPGAEKQQRGRFGRWCRLRRPGEADPVPGDTSRQRFRRQHAGAGEGEGVDSLAHAQEINPPDAARHVEAIEGRTPTEVPMRLPHVVGQAVAHRDGVARDAVIKPQKGGDFAVESAGGEVVSRDEKSGNIIPHGPVVIRHGACYVLPHDGVGPRRATGADEQQKEGEEGESTAGQHG